MSRVPNNAPRPNGRRRVARSVVVAALLAGVVALVWYAPVGAQGSRYYAGYALFSYDSQLTGPYGVSAKIYTINKNVPTGQLYAQWPTVMLSYAAGYWIQVGYTKGYDTNYQPRWYAEKLDATGYKKTWWNTSSPSAGTTYTYWIRRTNPTSGVWTGGVSSYWTWTFGTLNPNVPVDYQAFSETSDTRINIGGTHFSSLSVLSYNGIDWIPWYRHVPWVDLPYTLTEVSNSEFYASGGG
jgi:hypothetical protein